MLETKVYSDFRGEVYALLEDEERFCSKQIKILTKQMSIGKSYLQGRELPKKLKEVFEDIKFIFRVCPTTEVAGDGVFDKVESIKDDTNYKYRSLEDIGKNALEDYLNDLLENDNVYCFTFTHALLRDQFEIFLKFAEQSVLLIEEAHQFVGCADEGRGAYLINSGYSSEYTAETWKRIKVWMKVNPRVIGFTATPTEHHKGNELLSSGKYEVIGDLVPLKDILPHQKWLNKVNNPYHYQKNNGAPSIRAAVENSIDVLIERELKLEKLLLKDPNINPKLAGYYVCGDFRGVWGCPIDEVRNIMSEYLLSLGFDESTQMIATMVESGNTVWNLNGEGEKVENASDVFDRLEDPNDPVRFLLVINRGRSGINVHNFTVNVVCRIRDPKEIRTPIPIQIFGRNVRINVGTGSIIRDKYQNDIGKYLANYSDDYGIHPQTVIETIKVSNIFDIWYPENPKAKRTWQDSLDEFKEKYVNSAKDGYEFLYNQTGVQKPPIIEFLPFDLEIERECNGEMVKYNVSKEFKEWRGDGTLDKFFNI